MNFLAQSGNHKQDFLKKLDKILSHVPVLYNFTPCHEREGGANSPTSILFTFAVALILACARCLFGMQVVSKEGRKEKMGGVKQGSEEGSEEMRKKRWGVETGKKKKKMKYRSN